MANRRKQTGDDAVSIEELRRRLGEALGIVVDVHTKMNHLDAGGGSGGGPGAPVTPMPPEEPDPDDPVMLGIARRGFASITIHWDRRRRNARVKLGPFPEIMLPLKLALTLECLAQLTDGPGDLVGFKDRRTVAAHAGTTENAVDELIRRLRARLPHPCFCESDEEDRSRRRIVLRRDGQLIILRDKQVPPAAAAA